MPANKREWKLFTEEDGTFIMKIPPNWFYNARKRDGQHVFEMNSKRVGAFIVSVRDISSVSTECINFTKLPIQVFNKNVNFMEATIPGEDWVFFLWFARVENFAVTCSYTTSAKVLASSLGKSQLNYARKSIEAIVVIDPELRRQILAHEYFDKFLSSFVAAIDLSNHAVDNGSHIELLVLLASRVDAALRLLIVLNQQVSKGTYGFDRHLLRQLETDKKVTERQIYALAKSMDLIPQKLFERLNSVYSTRNKIVHRYIISDIKTRGVIQAVGEYFAIDSALNDAFEKIENLQKSINVGFYGADYPIKGFAQPMSNDIMREKVKEKHSIKSLNRKISIKNLGNADDHYA